MEPFSFGRAVEAGSELARLAWAAADTPRNESMPPQGDWPRRRIRRRWRWDQLMEEAAGELPAQLKDDRLAEEQESVSHP